MGLRFVFIGEQRSSKAIKMGVTWESERLAAIPLFHALREIGLLPEAQVFINLFRDGGTRPRRFSMTVIADQVEQGAVIVGMGRKVQSALDSAGVPHLKLTHPAARGRIRKRSLYIAHVREVLRSAETGVR